MSNEKPKSHKAKKNKAQNDVETLCDLVEPYLANRSLHIKLLKKNLKA